MTTVRISQENKQKLNDLKHKHELKSVDEVISHLLEVNRLYENSEVVRVIRCNTN